MAKSRATKAARRAKEGDRVLPAPLPVVRVEPVVEEDATTLEVTFGGGTAEMLLLPKAALRPGMMVTLLKMAMSLFLRAVERVVTSVAEEEAALWMAAKLAQKIPMFMVKLAAWTAWMDLLVTCFTVVVTVAVNAVPSAELTALVLMSLAFPRTVAVILTVAV